jgi:hypothetical protein
MPPAMVGAVVNFVAVDVFTVVVAASFRAMLTVLVVVFAINRRVVVDPNRAWLWVTITRNTKRTICTLVQRRILLVCLCDEQLVFNHHSCPFWQLVIPNRVIQSESTLIL